MPTIITRTSSAPTEQLAEVERAIREYHEALDRREHGGVAADKAIKHIEAILCLEWRNR